jgi:hypothetical protein
VVVSPQLMLAGPLKPDSDSWLCAVCPLRITNRVSVPVQPCRKFSISRFHPAMLLRGTNRRRSPSFPFHLTGSLERTPPCSCIALVRMLLVGRAAVQGWIAAYASLIKTAAGAFGVRQPRCPSASDTSTIRIIIIIIK